MYSTDAFDSLQINYLHHRLNKRGCGIVSHWWHGSRSGCSFIDVLRYCTLTDSVYTVQYKFWREKILANCKRFAKIFLPKDRSSYVNSALKLNSMLSFYESPANSTDQIAAS